jgi:hypothetical protein
MLKASHVPGIGERGDAEWKRPGYNVMPDKRDA